MVTRTGPLVDYAHKSRMLDTHPPTTLHAPHTHTSAFQGLPLTCRGHPRVPFSPAQMALRPSLGRCGGRRRGAGDTGGCREEVPRAQQTEGARGRAARGRRLPGLKPVAPWARLPLPGSEGRGRATRKGWGSGGNYDDGAGVEPRMRASLLAEFN